MRRVSRGFTLIELLVVIAIIAVLAAILFPVFISSKNRARMAVCQSNMKQLAAAMALYAGDWDGTLPMTQCQQPEILGQTTGRILWGMAIKKYCADKPHLFYCAVAPPAFVDHHGSNEQYRYYHSTTIGMNAALGIMVTEVNVWLPPTRISEVRVPSQTIMLGDSSTYFATGGPDPYWGPMGDQYGQWVICPGTHTQPVLGSIKYINPTNNWLTHDQFSPTRHGGMVNIACVDGHVVAKDRDWLLEPHSSNMKASNFTWWDKL